MWNWLYFPLRKCVCVTSDVIFIVCTLADNSRNPISAWKFESFCKKFIVFDCLLRRSVGVWIRALLLSYNEGIVMYNVAE